MSRPGRGTSSTHAGRHHMATQSEPYSARLDIDYPEKLSRLTTSSD